MADIQNPTGSSPDEGGQAPDSNNNNGANDGGEGKGNQGGSSGSPNPEPTEPQTRGNNAFFAGMRVAQKKAARSQDSAPQGTGEGDQGQGADSQSGK